MNFQKTFVLPEQWDASTKSYRKAGRWVVFDKNNLIPLLFVKKDNFHKLPWWWIEGDEDKILAFKRELLEETWCEVDHIQEVWTVIEQNSTWEQISYCFIWKVTKKWTQNFTLEEQEKWYYLKRLPIDQALRTILSDLPSTDGGKRVHQRDLYILQEIQKAL